MRQKRVKKLKEELTDKIGRTPTNSEFRKYKKRREVSVGTAPRFIPLNNTIDKSVKNEEFTEKIEQLSKKSWWEKIKERIIKICKKSSIYR